jgi:hypothetical protein
MPTTEQWQALAEAIDDFDREVSPPIGADPRDGLEVVADRVLLGALRAFKVVRRARDVLEEHDAEECDDASDAADADASFGGPLTR